MESSTSIKARPMSLAIKPFHLVAAAFYRIAYKCHHYFFLRPQPALRPPVFIVGSYLAGGAGKTPFSIWLAKHFQGQGKKVAILCHSAAWDEFIMAQQDFENALAQNPQQSSNRRSFPNKQNFPGHDTCDTSAISPEVKVIATKNRYATAKEIQDKFDIIICDDGFEDSRFSGAIRLCLDWQEPPTSWKMLIPNGPFRSLKQDHDEGEITHIGCYGKNGSPPDIKFSIESITNYIPGTALTATTICGLGSPDRFIEDIRAFGIHIAKSINRPDHDKRFPQVVKKELAKGSDIIITQKDACRLAKTILTHPKLHIAIQKITIPNSTKSIINVIIDKRTA